MFMSKQYTIPRIKCMERTYVRAKYNHVMHACQRKNLIKIFEVFFNDFLVLLFCMANVGNGWKTEWKDGNMLSTPFLDFRTTFKLLEIK